MRQEEVIIWTTLGALVLILSVLGALFHHDVRRPLRKLRTGKPLGFRPPGQGYQPIGRPSGPPPTPPPGGSIAVRPSYWQPAWASMVPLRSHIGQRQDDSLFKCSYCGRWGDPGSCDGCGAPNEPSQGIGGVLTVDGPLSEETAAKLRAEWQKAYAGIVPAFDMVKR